MIDTGRGVHQLVDGKRLCLGEHALPAVVEVGAVDILEEHGVGAAVSGHIDTSLAEPPYLVHRLFAHLSDQTEVECRVYGVERPREVKCRTSRHLHGALGSDNTVVSDMSYTADLVHQYRLLSPWGAL